MFFAVLAGDSVICYRIQENTYRSGILNKKKISCLGILFHLVNEPTPFFSNAFFSFQKKKHEIH